MKPLLRRPGQFALATFLALAFLVPVRAQKQIPRPPAEKALPDFSVQEIEKGLGVGYAVLLVDVNNDGKPDIVVVDQRRVVWYENPTWKRRTITEGQTKPDNVCIAAYDIDGDGKVDFALGAGWGNLTSKVGGPLYWLQRGKTLEEPWKVHPISEGEPSVGGLTSDRRCSAPSPSTNWPEPAGCPMLERSSEDPSAAPARLGPNSTRLRRAELGRVVG